MEYKIHSKINFNLYPLFYIFSTDFDFSCISNLYSFSVSLILKITSFHFDEELY